MNIESSNILGIIEVPVYFAALVFYAPGIENFGKTAF